MDRDTLLSEKEGKFDTDVLPVNDFPRKGEDASSIFTTDTLPPPRSHRHEPPERLQTLPRFHSRQPGRFQRANLLGVPQNPFRQIEDEQQEGRPRFAIRNADERNTAPGQKEVKDRVEQLFRESKSARNFVRSSRMRPRASCSIRLLSPSSWPSWRNTTSFIPPWM